MRKGVQDAAVKLLTNVETAQLSVFLNVRPSPLAYFSSMAMLYWGGYSLLASLASTCSPPQAVSLEQNCLPRQCCHWGVFSLLASLARLLHA